MEAAGSKVLVAQADVSNKSEMAELFKRIAGSMPPLRGIIHAAGVVDKGLLIQLSAERFEKVMAPKVQGAWNLHVLSQNTSPPKSMNRSTTVPLDFFVCFSSIASLLPSVGQGNYAAANAFLDGLAHYRRSLGLPGVSINWGAWANSGMLAKLGSRTEAHLVAEGMTLITPPEGLKVLQRLLGHNGKIGVLPIDWSRYNGRGVLLEKVLQKEVNVDQSLVKRLAEAQGHERKEILVKYLQKEVAQVLGLTRLPALTMGFTNMGMDSLMALSLSSRLEANLGSSLPGDRLPPTLALEYPTIETLAGYLLHEVLGMPSQREFEIDSSFEEELEIEQLTEDEVDALVAQELAELESLLVD
jgi:acyl carrier protein